MLHSPQAHPSQSDLVLQLRKQCFYFPALALRCRESRNSRSLARLLSRRFVNMDQSAFKAMPGSPRLMIIARTVQTVGHSRVKPSVYFNQWPIQPQKVRQQRE
jgi:hypothetical protein